MFPGSTEDRVRAVIAEQLAMDGAAIELHHTLGGDIDLDSLEVLQLYMALETECGVQFPDGAADTIRTVADLVEALNVVPAKESV